MNQSDTGFYGYAVLPPDYYTAFDPTTLAVAFNGETDIDAENRNESYYRYSVDEWQNYLTLPKFMQNMRRNSPNELTVAW